MLVSKNTRNLRYPQRRFLNLRHLMQNPQHKSVEYRMRWVPNVHFMFFVLISFAFGSQCKPSFQWTMGLKVSKEYNFCGGLTFVAPARDPAVLVPGMLGSLCGQWYSSNVGPRDRGRKLDYGNVIGERPFPYVITFMLVLRKGENIVKDWHKYNNISCRLR